MNKTLSITDKLILLPIWLIALLPLRVSFIFSDLLYLLIYYLIGYRKKVVFSNLRNSFPEKTEEEINIIAKRFYRFLCDMFFESLYLLRMNEKECKKRYHIKNPELIHQLYAEGKTLAAATGHYGNWEWASAARPSFKYTAFGIYKPLSNKRMDRFFYYLRTKTGGTPIPMKQTLRTIMECKKKGEVSAFYFVADQRPMKSEIKHWLDFLNQKTPVISGMDKLARKYNMPVVFINIERVRRGYYEVSYDLIEENPAETKPDEITENYMRHLEKMIYKQPELYLWSHKRWKFSYDEFKEREVKA